MKNISILTIAIALFAFVLTSCNSEGGSADAKGGSDATTTIADNSNPNNTNANQKNPAEAATAVVDNTPKTTLEFKETEHDWGELIDGDKAKHTFEFTNTGSEPLIISSAKGSCGCTVPKWPKEPIAPGESSQIDVEFNSANKKGKQTKTVTITANTEPAKTFLKVSSTVKPDPNKPAAAATANPDGKAKIQVGQ